jgi:hypothetical protein
MGCLNEHEFKVVSNMEKTGGSFVKALANAFHHADHVNKQILINSFPDYWAKYQPDNWDDNLEEQARQDFVESSFSGDTFLQ